MLKIRLPKFDLVPGGLCYKIGYSITDLNCNYSTPKYDINLL